MAAQPQKRVTSIDVARAADVSQATVSRVFSAPHLVAVDKRRKVANVAEELGYIPNAIARSLSSQSSRLIAVVVPAGSEYYQHALGEFARQVVSRDYQLLLFESFAAADLKVVFTSIPRYNVDAIIVASSVVPVAQVEPLVRQGYPVLMFNQAIAGNGSVMSVSVDNEAGTRQLAAHLIAGGHRRVCFVGGIEAATTDRSRYRGALATFTDAGLDCPYVSAGAYEYDAGYEATRRVMGDLPQVDGVMAASDAIAFGLIDGLRDLGVDVPGQVSVTGFDGLPQSAWKAYDLTTIDQPMADLADDGIDMVVRAIEDGGPPEVAHAVLNGRMRIRSSVRVRTNEVSSDGTAAAGSAAG